MGTSLSNLQILGAEESSVRAALPKAVVGRWSERFVTACPGELSFGPLNRRANQLSKTLSCTVLAVSIFDGDALDLTLYGQGKRLTHHIVNQEGDVLTAGNPKLFCSALGLPPETAPKLKRLFTASDQEEKLSIFGQLLGAPLYARWDTPESFQFTPADCAPLEAWLNDHPLPPKVKNRVRRRSYGDSGPVPGRRSGSLCSALWSLPMKKAPSCVSCPVTERPRHRASPFRRFLGPAERRRDPVLTSSGGRFHPADFKPR